MTAQLQQPAYWFLLFHDRHGRTSTYRQYTDSDEAIAAYNAAERENAAKLSGQNPQMDIVLVGADTLEEVRTGYPRYFADKDDRNSQLLDEITALAHA